MKGRRQARRCRRGGSAEQAATRSDSQSVPLRVKTKYAPPGSSRTSEANVCSPEPTPQWSLFWLPSPQATLRPTTVPASCPARTGAGTTWQSGRYPATPRGPAVDIQGDRVRVDRRESARVSAFLAPVPSGRRHPVGRVPKGVLPGGVPPGRSGTRSGSARRSPCGRSFPQRRPESPAANSGMTPPAL